MRVGHAAGEHDDPVDQCPQTHREDQEEPDEEEQGHEADQREPELDAAGLVVADVEAADPEGAEEDLQ